MGNQPSSQAYQESSSRPPPPVDRPLPPIPPPSSHQSTQVSNSAHKLSKPQTRSRSTVGLLKSPDGLDKGTGSKRFSASSIAHLVTSPFSSSPNSPSSPTTHTSSRRPRPLPLLPTARSPTSSGNQSPSVFTFEEAVVAITGEREPAAWRPISSIYPSPSLDLELLQEQQARQLDFEQRQRQNQLHYQQLLEAQNRERQQQREQQRERQIWRHSSFDVPLGGHEPTGTNGIRDPSNKKDGRRRLQQKLKQKHSSLLLSRSAQRSPADYDDLSDHGNRRRNSFGPVHSHSAGSQTWNIGSMTYDQAASQQYGGPLSENWPLPAGSRTSWNYDMTSYAAKRLLHIMDDDLPDQGFEKASTASESRCSIMSEVTWKSSHPVRPESPALTRANSDLSLYAPVRRTSIIQVPGVATRRNSTSSFAGSVTDNTRPAFRHSHPTTTPSLSRQTSFESAGSHVLSMPPAGPRHELSAARVEQSTIRVSTPPDGEYTAIGAFKLGSLRITNGAASPVSPEKTTRMHKTGPAQDEPSHNAASEAAARTQALAALSANSPSEARRDISTNAPGIQRLSTPKMDNAHDNRASAAGPSSTHAHGRRPSPVASPEVPQINLPEDLFAGFEFSSFSFEETTINSTTFQETSTTISMVQTTSKRTALEDHLFDEDNQSAFGFSGVEVLDIREDPSAKPPLKRNKNDLLLSRKSAQSVKSVGRSDSGFVPSPTSESSSRKPLSKADSGYSSNVSLRSFKQAASKLMAPVAKAANRLSSDRDLNAQASERDSFLIDELKLPSPTLDAPDMTFPSTSPAAPLPIKRKPVPPSSYRPPAPAREAPTAPPLSRARTLSPETTSKDALPFSPTSVSMTSTSTPVPSEPSVSGLLGGIAAVPEKKRHMAPAPLNNLQNISCFDSHMSPKSSPNPLTPVSMRSNGSASAVSIGSGRNQKPAKLLRFMSLGHGGNDSGSLNTTPLAVQITQIDSEKEAALPLAPSDVNEALYKSATLFPTAPQQAALKRHSSRDVLRAILSGGSIKARSSIDLTTNSPATSTFGVRDGVSRGPPPSVYQHSTSSSASLSVMMPFKAATKRKSRLSMAVDFLDGFETTDAQGTQRAYQADPQELLEMRGGNKVGKSRRSWRRRGQEGERKTPSPGTESSMDDEDFAVFQSQDQRYSGSAYDSTAAEPAPLQRPHSRSSSIISRTRSLTAQLERSLSTRFAFARVSRPDTSDENATSEFVPPVSTFSSALRDPSPPLGLPSDLPSPLYAEAMAQQRRLSMTPDSLVAPSPSMSIRMQQLRPVVLRVPPPLRSQSRPQSEAGYRNVSRQSSQSSLHSTTSSRYQYPASRPSTDYGRSGYPGDTADPSPQPAASPRQALPNWEAETDHGDHGLPLRRQQSLGGLSQRNSMDYDYGAGRMWHGSQNIARSNSMMSSYESRGLYGPPPRPLSGGPASMVNGTTAHRSDAQPVHMHNMQRMHMQAEGHQPQLPVLRYRASYDGYSNGALRGWDGGSGPEAQPYNTPRMSNGYTASLHGGGGGGGGHRRNGSSSSMRSDLDRLQKQQAWDYYYQQYARPPPNVPRSSHYRKQSARHGPVPGPQAPFRILHSYNSPAYRGVPIWG